MDELAELVKILIDASGVGLMCLFIGWYRSSLDGLKAPLRQALWSIIAAVLTGSVMLTAFHRSDGLVIDLRSTVIAMAVYLGGWVPGAAAMLTASAIRIHTGGSFTAYGLIGIGMTYALAVLLLYGVFRRERQLSVRQLLILALAVTAADLSAPFVTLDWPAIKISMTGYGPVEGLAVFLSVLFVYLIVSRADSARLSRDMLALRERQLSEKNAELGRLTVDLQTSQDELLAVMDHTVDGLITIADNGEILTFSRPAEDIFGYRADEVIGRPLDVLISGPATVVTRLIAAYSSGLEDPEAPLAATRELVGRCKDGAEFPMDLAIGAVSGQRDKFIVTIRNIAQRKLTEAQLLQSRKLEAVGHLAGGLAHDFNNILAAVMGFANLLVEDLAEDTPQGQYARRIQAAAQRAKDLVQQIVTISRQAQVEREVSGLKDVVQEVVSVFRGTLASNVRLEVDLDEGLPGVMINRAQVQQIITNLCLNARDSLTEAGGSISISVCKTPDGDPLLARIGDNPSADEGRIVFGPGSAMWGHPEIERGYVKLIIHDTGQGISDEVMRNMFDPFFSTKGRGRGTGLGLAFVHGALLEQKGAGVIESGPGEGTTFTIFLPAAQEEEQEGPQRKALQGTERVLIVDDEPDITDTLNLSLSKLGYEVLAVTTPEDAIAVLEADPNAWDIIASDLTMPGISGLDLFHQAEGLKVSARFILCSGFFDAELEAKARQAGVDALLPKPVSAGKLSAVIRSLMDENEPA